MKEENWPVAHQLLTILELLCDDNIEVYEIRHDRSPTHESITIAIGRKDGEPLATDRQ